MGRWPHLSRAQRAEDAPSSCECQGTGWITVQVGPGQDHELDRRPCGKCAQSGR